MTLDLTTLDSLTLDLTAGFVALLVDAGAGTWRETGIYTTGERGIVIGALPQTPGDLLGITPYVAQSDVEPGVDVRAFQVRVRSGSRDPRPALAVVDLLHDTLNGLQPGNLGGHSVPLIWRATLADLGLNADDRYEITDSYYLYVDKESRHG